MFSSVQVFSHVYESFTYVHIKCLYIFRFGEEKRRVEKKRVLPVSLCMNVKRKKKKIESCWVSDVVCVFDCVSVSVYNHIDLCMNYMHVLNVTACLPVIYVYVSALSSEQFECNSVPCFIVAFRSFVCSRVLWMLAHCNTDARLRACEIVCARE